MFVLLLEGKSEDGQPHRAMVQHGLPAGWEIAAKLAAGDVPGMTWLGKLSDTEAQPAADDRYAAVVALDAGSAGLPVGGAGTGGDARDVRTAGGGGGRHVPAWRVRPSGGRADHHRRV